MTAVMATDVFICRCVSAAVSTTECSSRFEAPADRCQRMDVGTPAYSRKTEQKRLSSHQLVRTGAFLQGASNDPKTGRDFELPIRCRTRVESKNLEALVPLPLA